jgi:hypothetical protein
MEIFKKFLQEEVDYLHDSILRSVNIDYKNDIITIVLSVESIEDWINVEFSFFKISEFSIKQPLNYKNDIVLSSGIKVSKFENIYIIDFFPYSTTQTTIEEYRKSKFYIAFSNCEFFKLEYSE